MLAHYVYASPAHHQQLEPRATTSPAPACTVNSDVVTNGNFYGYPNPPDYAPWALAPTIACWGHNVPYLENNSSDYGTAHVFFRVVLDHTVVIPQQLSCPSCTSSSQPGCKWYPDPTYKVVRGRIVTPSSGKGELKVLISQAKQTSAVSPLLVTAVRMITPGTDQYT
ncbi:MAG: hypothetical protein L6R41_002356 [Letrouitia leprolyta]|nr:MAG: hypothetical protein L6R41_002356 [Letrouitia leprolyta]